MAKKLCVPLLVLILVSACRIGTVQSSEEPPEGESVEANDGELLFVGINKSADQQYFIDLQASFVNTAEAYGIEAWAFDTQLDARLSLRLVEDAISAGADGIAITVPDQSIGPGIAQAASEANVVLIATDDNIVDANGNPLPFVGFNGSDMGAKVGEAAAEMLMASGWLYDANKAVGVLSIENLTLSVCNDRTDAEKIAIIAAGVSKEQILLVDYDGTMRAAQNAAGPVIGAHPDITNWVVVGCNDEGVLGSLNALDAAGVSPENIIGVGLGAYEACKPWASGQATGFKAALFISGLDVGQIAAQVLYDAVVNGIEPPKETFAPTTIVTPENYRDVMDKMSLDNCSQ